MAQRELFREEASLPNGMVLAPDFVDEAEEAALIEGIRGPALAEAQYKQYTAKRRVASFGAPLRARLAKWIGIPEEDFGYALVSEYRPGTQLGWHRDVPHFEIVAGVSLAGSATMRFRRFPPRKGSPVLTLELEPRSAYVLRNEPRWGWQHAIAPTPALRYSITFRTRRA